MSQSNAIAGALALAFLLFITLRGELPSYLNLFKPKSQASSGSSGTGGGTSKSLTDAVTQLSSYFGGSGSQTSSGGGSIGDGSTQSV